MIEKHERRWVLGVASLLLSAGLLQGQTGDARAQIRLDPAQKTLLKQSAQAGREIVVGLGEFGRGGDRKTERLIGRSQSRLQVVIGELDLFGKTGSTAGDGVPDFCEDWQDSITVIEDLGTNGDFNDDGIVDAADYVVWRNEIGTQDGLEVWKENYGKACK